MEIKRPPNEIVDDGYIFDGSRTSTGATSSPNNYDGEFEIFLFCRAERDERENRLQKKNNSHYALNCGGLLWICRTARPGALRDASVSARTFESINETIINLIDFNDVVVANLTKECGNVAHSHIPCSGEFSRELSKNVNRSNLLTGVRRSKSRKLIRMYRRYCICKIDPKIKIGWGNYDKISYLGVVVAMKFRSKHIETMGTS